jgi:hypothetical protein
VVPLVLVAATGVAGCSSQETVSTASYDVLLKMSKAEADAWRSRASGIDALDARLRAAYGVTLERGEIDFDSERFRGKSIGGYYNQYVDALVIGSLDEATVLHELTHRYNHHVFGLSMSRWIDEAVAYAFMHEGDAIGPIVSPVYPWDAIAFVRSAAATNPARLDELARALVDSSSLEGWLIEPRDPAKWHAAPVVVWSLLRDHPGEKSADAIRSTVASLESMKFEDVLALLRKGTLVDLTRGPVLAALLADPAASWDMLDKPIDLADAAQRLEGSPWGRRRLILFISSGGKTTSSDAEERRFFEKALEDPDRDVARAAVYALAKRGDRRMIVPLARAIAAGDLVSELHESHGLEESRSWRKMMLEATLAELVRTLDTDPSCPKIPALEVAGPH